MPVPSLTRYLRNRIAAAAAVLSIAVGIGTVGFVLTEDLTVGDALYQAIVVITTLGYSDLPAPAGGAGKAVLAVTLVLGVVALFGVIVTVAADLVERAITARRRQVVKLTHHHIVCGFGRIGQVVADQLRAAHRRVVVIDADPDRVNAAEESGYQTILGDAGEDDVLRRAGAEDAAAIVTTLADDAHNVFVLVSARALNGGIRTAATASSVETSEKLERIGAQHVVPTQVAAGRLLASTVTSPMLADLVVGTIDNVRVRQIRVEEGGDLDGLDVAHLLQPGSAVSIVAHRRPDGHIEPGPPSSARLAAGMEVLVAGDEEALDRVAGGSA
jgi:voltage-gated potassium channel